MKSDRSRVVRDFEKIVSHASQRLLRGKMLDERFRVVRV